MEKNKMYFSTELISQAISAIAKSKSADIDLSAAFDAIPKNLDANFYVPHIQFPDSFIAPLKTPVVNAAKMAIDSKTTDIVEQACRAIEESMKYVDKEQIESVESEFLPRLTSQPRSITLSDVLSLISIILGLISLILASQSDEKLELIIQQQEAIIEEQRQERDEIVEILDHLQCTVDQLTDEVVRLTDDNADSPTQEVNELD